MFHGLIFYNSNVWIERTYTKSKSHMNGEFYRLPKNLFDLHFERFQKTHFLVHWDPLTKKNILKKDQSIRSALSRKNKSSDFGCPNRRRQHLRSTEIPRYIPIAMACQNLTPTTYKIVYSSSSPRNKTDLDAAHKYLPLIPKLHYRDEKLP